MEHLIANMRSADCAEVRALGGLTPRQALEQSLQARGSCWTGLLDGEPAAIFGVCPLTVTGGMGVAWLLGTPLLERHWRTFARYSSARVAELLDRYDVLVNIVHADNRVALRWLAWLGATFTPNGDKVYFELRGQS